MLFWIPRAYSARLNDVGEEAGEALVELRGEVAEEIRATSEEEGRAGGTKSVVFAVLAPLAGFEDVGP